jgi:hypothetical protein
VRPVGIICRRRRKVNRAVQSFLDLLRDETRPRMSTAPIPPARQL